MQQSEWLCMGFWAVAIGWGLVACLEYFVFGDCKWFLFGWAALLWALLWDEAVLPVADEVVWSYIESLALAAGVGPFPKAGLRTSLPGGEKVTVYVE